jgi:hypothetical protein
MVLGFLSQWKKLLKPVERLKMDNTILKLPEAVKD